LVARLAARRTPLEDAQTLIAEFLAGPAAEKQQNAKLLFAGLFATLDGERREVMTALERFSGRRRELADRIRADVQQLRALQDAAGGDADKVSDLANQIAWETRIFEDRRRSIAYVCEVPQLIEQRLFALARAIQQALD
jgi:ABC-type transporter Mla subunit MlaD